MLFSRLVLARRIVSLLIDHCLVFLPGCRRNCSISKLLRSVSRQPSPQCSRMLQPPTKRLRTADSGSGERSVVKKRPGAIESFRQRCFAECVLQEGPFMPMHGKAPMDRMIRIRKKQRERAAVGMLPAEPGGMSTQWNLSGRRPLRDRSTVMAFVYMITLAGVSTPALNATHSDYRGVSFCCQKIRGK